MTRKQEIAALVRECRRRARLCRVRSKIVFEKSMEECWCPKCNSCHKRRIFAEDYEKTRCRGRFMVFCPQCEQQELERWRSLLEVRA